MATLKEKVANNREHWLTNCAEKLVPHLEDIAGKRMPDFRISMGFPSRNALSMRKRVIGQCWNKAVCTKGTHQLFISPMVSGDIDVAGVVAHELAHAIVGTEHGHKRPFGQVVRPLGLEGKLTATVPGEQFIKLMDPILSKLGPYPHQALKINPKYVGGGSRLIKASCPECDFKVRMTRTWLDDEDYGAPLCPKHRIQMVEG